MSNGAAYAPRPAASAGPAPTRAWYDTADHKRLGLMFIYAALLFLLASGVAGLVAGDKQASPSLSLTAGRFDRVYGVHSQGVILLFLTAIWIGLATYIVPLQIGAGRLALPRLTALGFWTYLFGGVCFLVSYLSGQVNGLGLTTSTPIPDIAGGANTATVLWIVSLGMVSLGFLLASASLLVTVAGLRTDGMTVLRLPAFSWATVVASVVSLVATPVFLGGLILLGVDQRFGGHLFSAGTRDFLPIWQRSLWLYGRPDVYLLTIVALGAASDIVATHAGRPLLDHRVTLGCLSLIGVLSFASWASSTSATTAVVVPTYNVLTAAVAVPLGLIVLMWLGTAAKGNIRFHVSILFVVGAIGLWVIGAANALGAALHHVDGLGGASAWVAGNVHTVVIGPPTLLAVGAICTTGRPRSGAADAEHPRREPGVPDPCSSAWRRPGSACPYYFLGLQRGGAGRPDRQGITSYQDGSLYATVGRGGRGRCSYSASSSCWWPTLAMSASAAAERRRHRATRIGA